MSLDRILAGNPWTLPRGSMLAELELGREGSLVADAVGASAACRSRAETPGRCEIVRLAVARRVL